jgi:hypothetical protein
MIIKLKNNVLATPGHPIQTTNRGWVAAKDIIKNDKYKTPSKPIRRSR